MFPKIVVIFLALFSMGVANSSEDVYSEFTVTDYLALDFRTQYSLIFQMRRSMRLGINWGHYRAAENGVSIIKGDEAPMGSCLLHLSTGSIMDGIAALIDGNPSAKKFGIYQAVSVVVLSECAPYDKWVEQLAIESN